MAVISLASSLISKVSVTTLTDSFSDFLDDAEDLRDLLLEDRRDFFLDELFDVGLGVVLSSFFETAEKEDTLSASELLPPTDEFSNFIGDSFLGGTGVCVF